MLKRLFDICASLSGLIVLSPILLLTAIFIKLDSKGPIFFRQERVGLHGKKFRIHKFRSMYINSGLELTSGEDKRITKVGKIIRKLHLDEVIQLIDVLQGNMSIVGPRPEVPKYIKYYPEKWKKVLSVRPGITGYGVIKTARFEYETLAKTKNIEDTYIKKVLPKKLDCEVYYATNHNLWLDLKIIFKTILNNY
jgi:lipopolysaccharide/colanic/teichoic acid biosynthesis glycosyltransferase